MKTLANGPIPHSHLSQSEQPGSTIAVIGGTHGNELVGLSVIENFATSVQSKTGELLLIVGNPEAVMAGQRSLEHDINQSMDAAGIEAALYADRPSAEQERVLELAQALGIHKPAIAIDIHNTILPSEPFIYCEASKAHFKLLKYFGLAKTVYSPAPGYKGANKSAVDNFVDRQGGIGITYETGCLQDGNPSDVVDIVQQEIINLLAAQKVVDHSLATPLEGNYKEHFEVFDNIIAQGELEFTKPIGTGVAFAAGEIIAYDKGQEILAPEDCVVLFPKGQIVNKGFACELARPMSIHRTFEGRNDPGTPWYDA